MIDSYRVCEFGSPNVRFHTEYVRFFPDSRPIRALLKTSAISHFRTLAVSEVAYVALSINSNAWWL